jgi:hypothetical protein
MSAGAVIVGSAAGNTVISLLDVIVPTAPVEVQYVSAHVSVIFCPHAVLPAALNVDVAVPLIKHAPDSPFV